MDRLIENIPGMGFDIWCDDSFLSQTGPPDAPLPPQPHENPHGDLIYWDNRPLEVNGQAWVLMPVPKCDEDLQAFHMDGGSREIIVLCPKMFEHYSDLGDYQIDMTSRPPTFSKGIHIDSFATSLMFVLVHEVSHCDFFLQNLVTSDIPADVDGYGWQEAVRHADNNHLYALKNAGTSGCLTISMMQHADPSRLDNFALFVLGSYDPSDRHSFYRLIVTDNPKPCFCPKTTGAPG
ncbi:protein kinase, putative [Trichophyton verrucosum HKI 0517]|uniref:Protein kinase, putative n=1 Tax=Trichophyton verrucosum (strain HKI 0517) TaxID=663202 RepID=D4CZM1_TRIVH|nr:protein kinase, putative [Trichophyton verrucosum HKI 0517]EFE44890.1 protein kinase, putative [Trichophyton verrucosum HKI 0517]